MKSRRGILFLLIENIIDIPTKETLLQPIVDIDNYNVDIEICQQEFFNIKFITH